MTVCGRAIHQVAGQQNWVTTKGKLEIRYLGSLIYYHFENVCMVKFEPSNVREARELS